MEKQKNTPVKLNRSKICVQGILNGYLEYTFKIGRTNIDALATGHYQCAIMKCIDGVLSEPVSTFF